MMTNKQPITKSDICWILIKVAGFWLLYTAIATLYASVVTWFSMSDLVKELPKNSRGSLYSPIKVIFYSAFPPLAGALYLLKSGTAIHHCLMSIPVKSRNLDAPFPDTEQDQDKNEAFKAWLADHPDFASRHPSDQMALFRDFQRQNPDSTT
ncbi:hypothetical protein V2O64_07935 [Verrucomicrobiaceae bacterium 227]